MSVFEIRLGRCGPAKFKPMKIFLDPANKPVKVKVRKYPAEQIKLLNVYFSNLMDIEFLKPCLQVEWQAALHLVPKECKSKFRMTIGLRHYGQLWAALSRRG